MFKFLYIALLLTILAGCTHKENPQQEVPASEPVAVKKYGINLNDYPDESAKDYSLQQVWEFDLAEKYGRPFYKANNICSDKYSYILDKSTDTSTSEGSLVIDEFNLAHKKCVIETLKNVIPEPQTNSNNNDEIQQAQDSDYFDDRQPNVDLSQPVDSPKEEIKVKEETESKEISKEEELEHVRKVLDEGDAPPEVKIIVYCTRKAEIYYKDINMQKNATADCINDLNPGF
ncbi:MULTISPECIES: hypothetical protein [Acinetobacter]|uniref:hypothetical protein n=1 Tax=Acinetobacter TaxID=469 RepID=UPI00111F1BC2|nr:MULTISPECIES: hypothetical protein [Acinetobacter]